MDLTFDAIYWQRSGDNISPRHPALPVAGREYVREGVPHLDGLGRDVLPPENRTAYGEGYGTDGTEFVGTMTGDTPPEQPGLAVEDLGGGFARLTISGSTVGTTNDIYIRLATATEWPSTPTETIAGDGTSDIMLGAGPYLAKVMSRLLTSASPGALDPVLFFLADASAGYTRSAFGEEWAEHARPALLEACGEPVTYRRGIQTVSVVAIQARAVHARDMATGVDLELGDCSWEIDADDLDFGAGPIVPKAQDQVITAKGEVYVVVEAGALDAEQVFWTIPVKRNEYKELA